MDITSLTISEGVTMTKLQRQRVKYLCSISEKRLGVRTAGDGRGGIEVYRKDNSGREIVVPVDRFGEIPDLLGGQVDSLSNS